MPFTALLAEPAAEPTVHGTAVTATLLEVFDDTDATYELYRMGVVPGVVQISPAHQPGVTEHITVFAGVLRAHGVEVFEAIVNSAKAGKPMKVG